MSQTAISLKYNGFYELNEKEQMLIDGGGFWDGLALVGGSLVVAGTAVAIVATTPITAPAVGAVIAGSYIASQFGFGVGLAMMFGADL